MAAMVRVAVAGASGYMGAELRRLLCVHPNITLTGVTSDRLAGEALTKAYPHLRGLSEVRFHDLDAGWLPSVADVVFLALPHMESQKAVPILRTHGRRAIDLSADYRLRDPSDYVTWYKAPHIDLSGLGEAVYGLAELHRKAIAQAALVATPGCYPAGAILATAPLFRAGLARLDGVVIDGKSGVTGAGAQGRRIDPMYLYTEANENVQAYGMASHRHTPEIEQELGALAGAPLRVAFTPHLVPLNRGLFTTASVPVTSAVTTTRLLDVYREFYAGEPFVRVLDGGITAVPGILAGGIAAGIKPSGKKDLALIYSSTPAGAAAVFTSNQVKGAPVLVSSEHVRGGQAQAIVASSGCANVCTGEQGIADAREMTRLVGDFLRIPASHVLVAATGVIGLPLPMDKIRAAMPNLVKSLSPQGGRAAAEAIMTTDTRPKEAALRVEVGGRPVTIGGIAKGVAMLEPHLATMFCFVASDAAVARGALGPVLRRSVDRSFNRTTVDSDQSTSDT